MPAPQIAVARGPLTGATVTWYGSETRRVQWASGDGGWYKGGHGLVPIRWVYVKDVQGTHRDEYFFTTDPTLRGPEIISLFTARWAIETTFQEMRAHLGFETTRQRTAKAVLRTGPCLLGLFSLVCLIFAEHARYHRLRVRSSVWYTKAEPTFSDALATVLRLFWLETILERPAHYVAFTKLHPNYKTFCWTALPWRLDAYKTAKVELSPAAVDVPRRGPARSPPRPASHPAATHPHAPRAFTPLPHARPAVS